MTKLSLIATVALTPIATTAFAPIAPSTQIATKPTFVVQKPLFAEVEENKATEAAFVPVEPEASEGADDDVFAKAESLGKGSAKVRRKEQNGTSCVCSKKFCIFFRELVT